MPNYRRLFIDNSYLFITIVTHNRVPILIDNVSILRKSFKQAKEIYEFDIYAISILPDHFHMILIPENIKDYPKIIRAIKYNFSKMINDGGIAIPPYISRSPSVSGDSVQCQTRAVGQECLSYKRNKEIWQKRYYEHTIISEEDLHNHLDYIHYNPVKHGHVKCVKDWEHSSFHKFVEQNNYDINWGSEKDIEKIKELSYE